MRLAFHGQNPVCSGTRGRTCLFDHVQSVDGKRRDDQWSACKVLVFEEHVFYEGQVRQKDAGVQDTKFFQKKLIFMLFVSCIFFGKYYMMNSGGSGRVGSLGAGLFACRWLTGTTIGLRDDWP